MTINDLPELKTTYRVLHRNLVEYPQLMECDFLDDLQRHLQRAAQADGVDISDHGQWDAWLGGEGMVCKKIGTTGH